MRGNSLKGLLTLVTSTHIDPPKQQSAQWRRAAATALFTSGFACEAEAFQNCESPRYFRHVEVCSSDLDHPVRIIPFTCHLRYCPNCEAREQARKLPTYVAALLDVAVDYPNKSYSLKKFVLTTPYHIADPDAPALFKRAWESVRLLLGRVMFKVLEFRGKLSPGEIRRGRADLKKHGVGFIAQSEFGEDGHKLHFHLTGYCPYIDQNFLTDCWREVTGGECSITWIQKIDETTIEDAVKEQVKYVTKFTALPPDLVPALAAVLAGQRRTRLYGVFAKMKQVAAEQRACAICEAKLKLLPVQAYITVCNEFGKKLDDEIVAAYEQSIEARAQSSLQFKHGNNSGEVVIAATGEIRKLHIRRQKSYKKLLGQPQADAERPPSATESPPDRRVEQNTLPHFEALTAKFEYF